MIMIIKMIVSIVRILQASPEPSSSAPPFAVNMPFASAIAAGAGLPDIRHSPIPPSAIVCYTTQVRKAFKKAGKIFVSLLESYKIRET